MVDFGSLGDKAKDFIDKNEEKIDDGLEKAGDAAGKRFGHEDQIDKGVDKLQGLTGDNDKER